MFLKTDSCKRKEMTRMENQQKKVWQMQKICFSKQRVACYIVQLQSLRTYISGNWVPSRNLVLQDIGGNLGIGVLCKSCFGKCTLDVQGWGQWHNTFYSLYSRWLRTLQLCLIQLLVKSFLSCYFFSNSNKNIIFGPRLCINNHTICYH